MQFQRCLIVGVSSESSPSNFQTTKLSSVSSQFSIFFLLSFVFCIKHCIFVIFFVRFSLHPDWIPRSKLEINYTITLSFLGFIASVCFLRKSSRLCVRYRSASLFIIFLLFSWMPNKTSPARKKNYGFLVIFTVICIFQISWICGFFFFYCLFALILNWILYNACVFVLIISPVQQKILMSFF